MVNEFHERNKSVSFTKAQIQEKEGQLKRDYKMLKAARMQSGSKWNEQRNMVEGPAAMWDNLIVTFPKIKKFRNNKATFPLFDDLGELYDGHLAEGNYNVTSLQPQHDEEPLVNVEDDTNADEPILCYAGKEIHNVEDDTNADEEEERTAEQAPLLEIGAAPAKRRGQQKPVTAAKKPAKEERPRKKYETMMGRFLELREKEAEDQAVELARERGKFREKKTAEGQKYSIQRCISVIDTMELTVGEKAKAIAVITKSNENREAFLCTFELNQECALVWLKNEMA